MLSELRLVTTDEITAHSPDGWLALGDQEADLEPDGLHVLAPVSGLTADTPAGRLIVAKGRFRYRSVREAVEHTVLVPVDLWETLRPIETLIDLVGAAGSSLVEEVEAYLRQPGQEEGE